MPAAEFEVWDDDEIFAGGIELSLLAAMRQTVRTFLENTYISSLFLGMTLFLCLVIFIEIAFDKEMKVAGTNEKTPLGVVFLYIDNILLSFFMVEIVLKLFAYFLEFLGEFINVFDSVIVIVSFAFIFTTASVSFLGILRTLRLIKVMTEMRRVAQAKKALQESIKQQKK